MQNFVIPHDPAWSKQFADEAAAIRATLGKSAAAIHHIGSTSIEGILAKPVIDILVETPSLSELDRRSAGMADLGYESMGPSVSGAAVFSGRTTGRARERITSMHFASALQM